MSSVLKFPEKREIRELDLSEILLSQMSKLCMSEEFSDVTFKVEDEKISGHLSILAARSEYFRALLFGGLDESTQEIIKLQVPICAFKAILKYIYTGHLALSEIGEEDILDVLGLANQYGFTELDVGISEYLYHILSLDNVCTILNAAELHGLTTLKYFCHKFLDMNASRILIHESFKNLREESLKEILLRDSFGAPEFQIFTAVREWCRHNPNVAIESVTSLVRLPLICSEELFNEVRISGIFDSDTLLDALNEKATSTSLKLRRGTWKEENFATEKFGARVIEGECGCALLDGDTRSYDLNNGFTRHKITENNDLGIIVELGASTIINHIKLLLLDRYCRRYSYFVEVSVNKIQWDRVVNHQSYHCRSWQFLYFRSRAVRYIKLVGTYGSKKLMFEVVSLEAYYSLEIPKMIEGIVVPTRNVATIEMGAVVTNCEYPQNLLNGDISKAAFHTIGKGTIVIQLGQVYIIGSMRLLLLDCDGWNYSYFIETSINHKDWEIVVDKRNQNCRSLQVLTFEPKAMIYIRITGTKSSGSNGFECLHYECPSNDAIKKR